MQSGSVSITFAKEEDPDEEIILSLELDSDANEDKTTFEVGENAYLRFLSSIDDPYIIEVSMGTARTVAANIHYPVKDDKVQFANTDLGYLRYIPCCSVVYGWVGKSAGTPVFAGREVMLKGPATAMLNCNYKTKGDRLAIKSNEAGTVLVVVIQGEKQASLSVTFEEEEEEEEEVSYELEVKDYCTDGVLPGATIYLDGKDIGQTSANGIIALGALIPGSTHSLRMAKAGYISSEKDKLNNDSFTVPT